MKNPFLEFKNLTISNIAIPLARIDRENRLVMEDLLAAYRSLDPGHVRELCRLLDHGLRLNVYKSMLPSMDLPRFLATTLDNAAVVYESSLGLIRTVHYSPDDIEELCAVMGLSKETDVEQSGPMGLYISALINGAKEHCIKLNLHRHPRRLHFLGFGLETGKQLSIIGDLGHFSGAGLVGGDMTVTGSTGSWCGAGMASGRIRIFGDALSKTGQLMKGGQIKVDGRILEIAKSRSGGEVRGNAKYG